MTNLAVPEYIPRRASLMSGIGMLAVVLQLLSACVGQPPVKAVETLDQGTGMTLAALFEPLAFVETGIYELLAPDKQPNVLYVGPVEWDRSGDFTYLLWIELAPGVDGHRIDDIGGSSAVLLTLDDGTVALPPFAVPDNVSHPYMSIEPVGPTGYFSVDIALLRRMAASSRIVFHVKASDLSMIDFVPRQETHDILQQYLVDRSIAAD